MKITITNEFDYKPNGSVSKVRVPTTKVKIVSPSEYKDKCFSSSIVFFLGLPKEAQESRGLVVQEKS